MSAPCVVLVLPVEGGASARVVCETFEEELRVAAELRARDVLADLADVLALLLEQCSTSDGEPPTHGRAA